MLFRLVISLVNIIQFYSSVGLSQITGFLPEIYMYFIILLSILFLVIFALFINYKQKRKILEKVYRKLSDSDKQVFHVIRATKKRSLSTLQNVISVFYKITGQKIENKELMQRLYRLENVGLVKISITSLNGDAVQVCKVLYGDYSLVDLITKNYGLISGIFLPLSIISLSICYYLLQFIDLIVHGDLYGYGLVFSYEWANQYWNITASIRSSLNIMFFLLAISLVLSAINFHKFKKVLKITICSIFTVGIALVAYSLFLLSRLDFIVNNDLYYFGLQFASLWAEKYWMYISFLYILLGLSLGAILVSLIFCIFSQPINKNN